MKKIIIIFICIFLIMNISGCNKKDINEFSTAVCAGLDKTDKGFKLSVQTVNPNVLGRKPLNIAPSIVMSTEGDTVNEAFMKMSEISGNKLFIFHIQFLLLGEELAKEGIEKYLRFFIFDWQTQHNYNIIVIENDTAENALKIQSTLHLIPALAIEAKLENSNKIYGLAKITYIDEVINTLYSKGNGLILSGIKIDGDPEKGEKDENTKTTDPDAVIRVSTLAVFKGDKLVGWLTNEETLGYKHIMGKLKLSVVNIILENKNKIGIRISKTSSKIDFKLENNNPIIVIKHKMEVSINDSIDINMIEDIKNKIDYEVSNQMKASINKAYEFNSDIFHFCEVIHRKDINYYNSIINQYDEVFKNIKVEIIMDTTIKRTY